MRKLYPNIETAYRQRPPHTYINYVVHYTPITHIRHVQHADMYTVGPAVGRFGNTKTTPNAFFWKLHLLYIE